MKARSEMYQPKRAGAAGTPVQVFGVNDSQPTRAALRFFKERGVALHFVDLRRRMIARGELHRFVEGLGVEALADSDGRTWHEQGLGYLRMTGDELTERLLADYRLLRLPLIRRGSLLTVGSDPSGWQEILGGPS